MAYRKVFAAIIFLTLFPFSFNTTSSAQDLIQKSEGVRGDTDKKKRNPIIFVSKHVSSGNVKILADSFVPNPDYRGYPIQFDFYVNRHLFSTQFRSPELPGAVGIDVGPEVTLPFNFSIVARVLHPNRHFTSVITGAVFQNNYEGVLDCTLTLGASSAQAEDFFADDVTVTQNGNDGFTMNFTATDDSENITVAISGNISEAGNSSTAIITRGDASESVVLSGTVEATESGLSSIEISSADEDTALSCS